MSAELNSLDVIEQATVEGISPELEQLIVSAVLFLHNEGVPRHRIAELATPAIFTAYRKYL